MSHHLLSTYKAGLVMTEAYLCTKNMESFCLGFEFKKRSWRIGKDDRNVKFYHGKGTIIVHRPKIYDEDSQRMCKIILLKMLQSHCSYASSV